MIIKNSDLLGKKLKNLILIISFVIDIIIVASIVSIIVITCNSTYIEKSNNIFVLIILSILGSISIIDIIEIKRNKKSIAYTISKKFLKNVNDKSILPFNLNSTQQVFCETVFGMKDKNRYIYVFGKRNKGKSTAILYLLDGFSKNIDDLNEIPWIDNFTFIDCTSNKKEILDYFLMNDPVNTRISQFSNSLIVIDNIEHLGKTFFEENVGLFSSYKSLFIIIEDTTNDLPLYKLDSNNRCLLVSDFNSSVIGIKPIVNLYENLKAFNSTERKVFFSLYFLTCFSEFAYIYDIKNIIKINKISLHRALNKIKKLAIYIPFPFNTKYYYCSNRNYIKKIDNLLYDFSEYKTVLEMFVKSSSTNAECRWLCFIRSNDDIISNMPKDKKRALFHKALYNGKYFELYNELSNCIKNEHKKEKLLLYEKGFLSFYIGNHKNATAIFSELVNAFDSSNEKKEMMLHIIESSHGNPDSNNMNLICKFIGEMQAQNDFYSVCATYWKKHIDTEKGVFKPTAFSNLRKNIRSFPYCNNSLYRSIVHRCFLDEIRCCHILGNRPSNQFLSEYISFLKSCSQARNDYYLNLYIEANTMHYVEIIDTMLSDNYSSEDLIDLTKTAEAFYNKALSSTYSDEKSKRATKIKLLDLCMIYNDFDYENTVNQVNLFNIHSQINDVQVHEAFCETILIKTKILSPSNLSDECGLIFSDNLLREIHNHFEKGYMIYRKYGNYYGMLRLDFLMLLFDLLKSGSSSKNCVERLIEFKEKCYEYPKELRIVEYILDRYKNNLCSTMLILSIIRAYPIILQ